VSRRIECPTLHRSSRPLQPLVGMHRSSEPSASARSRQAGAQMTVGKDARSERLEPAATRAGSAARRRCRPCRPVVSSPPPSEPDLRVPPHPALHEHVGWCRFMRAPVGRVRVTVALHDLRVGCAGRWGRRSARFSTGWGSASPVAVSSPAWEVTPPESPDGAVDRGLALGRRPAVVKAIDAGRTSVDAKQALACWPTISAASEAGIQLPVRAEVLSALSCNVAVALCP
jgi:hypothetical protein